MVFKDFKLIFIRLLSSEILIIENGSMVYLIILELSNILIFLSETVKGLKKLSYLYIIK